MKTLIFAVTLIALSAVAGSIIVGEKVYDGVVVNEPYETGLLWDKNQKDKDESGWKLNIQNEKFGTGDNKIIFSVADKRGKPLANAKVTVSISRPETVMYDRSFEAAQMPDGAYRAAVNLPRYGNWDLIINVAQDEKSIAFKNRIFAENKL